ncbi:uncharacterized protein LOC121651668 [Melanotaenia boesemani]|uniref:uncharacterized protein LOC121651668 n=1 Tax=Melanotaenia boesemani TaxID=1250792 RepID=UPI001C05998C|nr:uncharacterized protein LOC121651668 [Melanotaenia boesemani]
MKEPVVIALFCGMNKPNSANEFLKDFVVELQQLEKGFDFNGKRLFLKVDSVICDAPARAFVKCIKPHNGYYGCDKCVQRGQYVNRRMTFPSNNSMLRTDESFACEAYEDHQNGPSPFHGSNIGMVTQFPLDYMHLVCLGVVRKLLLMWLRGPLTVRLSANVVNRMSEHMKKLRPDIPIEFARKPRSFREIDRWKATEFRQFLLYTGPVILSLYLESTTMYNNFMLLFSAISILINPDLALSYCQYAQTLLETFVKHFGEIYGNENIVYNVHGLIHLPLDVQQFGSLDRISAFPFENHLRKMKKLVRKPERPIAQIIRRLSEKRFAGTCTPPDQDSGLALGSLKKQHFDGPVPDGLDVQGQYGQLDTDQWTMKVSRGNNIFLIGDDICVIDNIVECISGIYVVYRVFSDKKDFFTYPFSSDLLNIYSVSQALGTIKYAELSAVRRKCIALPYRRDFVVMPLLHSSK